MAIKTCSKCLMQLSTVYPDRCTPWMCEDCFELHRHELQQQVPHEEPEHCCTCMPGAVARSCPEHGDESGYNFRKADTSPPPALQIVQTDCGPDGDQIRIQCPKCRARRHVEPQWLHEFCHGVKEIYCSKCDATLSKPKGF